MLDWLVRYQPIASGHRTHRGFCTGSSQGQHLIFLSTLPESSHEKAVAATNKQQKNKETATTLKWRVGEELNPIFPK